jgi:prevent-host-death family protein
MTRTTAVEFRRQFGEFGHRAQREKVEITRHGRRELVLMSADHYDWLVAAGRRSHRTAQAADIVAEAVGRATMDKLPGTGDDETAAEASALVAAVAVAEADPRRVRHEAVRAWLLRLARGELDAPPPETG